MTILIEKEYFYSSCKDILQALIEAELDTALGYEKNHKWNLQPDNKTNINSLGDISSCQNEIERITRKKERSYQDYVDDIISRDEYIKYKAMYEQEIAVQQNKIDTITKLRDEQNITVNPWIKRLLQYEDIEHLDRETVVEMISMIYVYENNTVKIVYNFSDELEILLKNVQQNWEII